MNQLMFGIRNHYIANEIIKFIKKYSINFEKIMKRLQLTIFKHKKNQSRHSSDCCLHFERLQTRSQQDLFWFFCVDSKGLSRCWFNDQKYKIDREFSSKCFFNDDFVKNFSVIVNRVDITEIDIPTSSIRTTVFKFLILKIVSVTSRKTSQVKRID